MILNSIKGPFIKSESTISSMMRDMLFVLGVLLILPVVYHGIRPLVMAGVTMLVSVLSEILFSLVQTKSIDIADGSSMVAGLMIVMFMPVNCPLWLPCIAAAFAIFAAKMPFGSLGNTPFNSVAAGVAFTTLCWPDTIFKYIKSSTGILPAFGNCAGETISSSAAVLKNGLKPDILPLDMLWGVLEGPMGTTSILIIGACALYLFIKRTAKWEITVSFLAAAVLIAAVWPRIACSPLTSVKYELMSGSLLFCSVFMVTDPVTSPNTTPGRVIYGLFSGSLIMAFRWFGAFEQGACFAVLIANAVAPQIDLLFCGSLRMGDMLYEE